MISVVTESRSSGTEPGMISGPASSLRHRVPTMRFIIRSTPRVRWKRCSVDQSTRHSQSNSFGMIGYDALMRSM